MGNFLSSAQSIIAIGKNWSIIGRGLRTGNLQWNHGHTGTELFKVLRLSRFPDFPGHFT